MLSEYVCRACGRSLENLPPGHIESEDREGPYCFDIDRPVSDDDNWHRAG
jgi:hypothetical protein